MIRDNVDSQTRSKISKIGPKLDRIPWGILGFLCLLAIFSVLFLDDSLALWIYEWKPSWPLRVWPMGFRQLGKVWAPIWLLCLWFWVARRSRPVLCAILALLLTPLLVLPLKGCVGRARPGEVFAAAAQSVPESGSLRGHSFPSGDTATVFAVVGALIGFVRRPWLCLLFAGALGIGVLRVIILAHYVSDVCAGMAIGLFCAHLAQRLDRRLNIRTERLDQRPWIALIALGIIPLVTGLCEGPETVLYFYQTFGIMAVVVALLSRIAIWTRCSQ